MSSYKHTTIEPKWQNKWKKEKIFEVEKNLDGKKKKYILDMFPYPSGSGLHVGHPEGYTATDIYSRYLRMNGFNVLHPIGWDAFGLPAENYAIKNKIHPKTSTSENIKTFTRQIKSLGFSYDWSREVNTSSLDYYKWTQWIFLQMYKAGLAYKKEAPVNWCDSCKTVLANEQVTEGKCERCSSPVTQKNLDQWFFKITGSAKKGSYPERLLLNLEKLDWPEPIKTMQKNWIGKSEGAILKFKILNSKDSISVFTTRPDTLYGATYLVLAPEHLLIEKLKSQIQNLKEVETYIQKAVRKNILERTGLGKEKTGVEIKGLKALNPATGEEVSIWVADYVIMSYGLGAIMAVPAHDERDFEFAKKFNLPVRRVIKNKENIPSTIFGVLENSEEFNGMESEKAKLEIIKKLGAEISVQYKLRDWLISRQRYWGAPIPIIYCEDCGEQPVPEKDLPVELPEDVDFRPKGESPLARSESFHKVKCPKCKKLSKRESDTMDTFVDSSWYYLRYLDPKNKKEFASKESIESWMPVDVYVGGAEHAVLHLMYARFIYMALCDIGVIGYKSIDEPFLKLRNQGLILGPDGQKMSKSKGNVINPDEVVKNFGADTLRMYEMFMGPLGDSKPWDTNGIIGVRRFLERVWSSYEFITEDYKETKTEKSVAKELGKLIKKVTKDIESFCFNTAVSQFMIFINVVFKEKEISKNHFEDFLKVLNPFAPHISNELWEKLGNKDLLEKEKWPRFNEKDLEEDSTTYIVSINGKVRAKIFASSKAQESEIASLAKKSSNINKYLVGKKIEKTVFVPKKLINFVVK